MKTIKALALSLMLWAGHSVAGSESDRLLVKLKQAYPKTSFTEIAKTPIKGLYEVWMGENVAFVSKDNPRYFIFGRMLDTVNLQDMTAAKLARAPQRSSIEIVFGDLPIADALKTIRGDGSRSLAVFSDPSCPYCKRLETELEKLDNVTIYTFLVPFQKSETARNVWCAENRELAWRRAMLMNAEVLPATPSCADPLQRNLSLAQKLNIRGTPTLIFSDGRRMDGYSDVAEIAARLEPENPAGATVKKAALQEEKP